MHTCFTLLALLFLLACLTSVTLCQRVHVWHTELDAVTLPLPPSVAAAAAAAAGTDAQRKLPNALDPEAEALVHDVVAGRWPWREPDSLPESALAHPIRPLTLTSLVHPINVSTSFKGAWHPVPRMAASGDADDRSARLKAAALPLVLDDGGYMAGWLASLAHSADGTIRVHGVLSLLASSHLGASGEVYLVSGLIDPKSHSLSLTLTPPHEHAPLAFEPVLVSDNATFAAGAVLPAAVHDLDTMAARARFWLGASSAPPSHRVGLDLLNLRPAPRSMCSWQLTAQVHESLNEAALARQAADVSRPLRGPPTAGDVAALPTSLIGTAAADATGSPAPRHVDEVHVVLTNGVLKSAKCGLTLKFELASVDPYEFERKTMWYLVMLAATAVAQLAAFVIQLEHSRAHPVLANVSMLAIGALSVVDCYLCLLHFSGLSSARLAPSFAIAAFVKFVLSFVYEMRYVFAVWRARNAGDWAAGWLAVRVRICRLYSWYYVALLIGITAMYQFDGHWPWFSLLVHAYWIPQIVTNAQRDTANALAPVFVLGTSASRLIIPAYMQLCPTNVFHTPPTPGAFTALTLLVAGQVIILLAQARLGPRFFVPAAWLDPPHNYHPPPAVILADSAGEQPTCTICMERVDLDPPPPGRSRTELWMHTPCKHTFHTLCLIQWMDIRLECPVCRAPLPHLAHASQQAAAALRAQAAEP
ncbi:uncharacterized protein AMSG_04857 [Thecamonas trahens ATCC 50062]|uniref:RING-type E3 ubiquitin transferase n=1 Tax=Thecamonas trahens ATCC 50062 TaxID=461836 RepID=A0A0L0DAT4_THETB|nr:hypothetical protein AMSG_04857 [Thecamonas trahens ATCC 50062]KNC48408.1 hypothetical protein AMSG_04857 [Thecamonas trahens ATCC 50062]|eukprot:XP_013758525.1 hypothetical protein AMSG_04857 [Thecamonas trahens ATCC 50062]